VNGDPTLDLEFLMSEDPLGLSKQDLDILIQYHRNIRADRAAGRKTHAVATATPKGLKALLDSKKPVLGVERRGR
jgi:hypothetical protein